VLKVFLKKLSAVSKTDNAKEADPTSSEILERSKQIYTHKGKKMLESSLAKNGLNDRQKEMVSNTNGLKNAREKVSSSSFLKVLKTELDGRSLQAKTINAAFDDDYAGDNKNILALRYIIDLPDLIGEDVAVSYLKGITAGRPFGWKSIADIAYLCINHTKAPLDALNAVTEANINYKHHCLPDGSPANDGGSIVVVELVKQTGGLTLGNGAFGSKTKGAAKAKNLQLVSDLRMRLVNICRDVDHFGLNEVQDETLKWCDLVSKIKTDDTEALAKAVELSEKIA